MKFSFKRILAVALTLVMVLGMMPVLNNHVHAAGNLTVTDPNVGLSWTDASNSSGNASWTATGNTVTGTATGYKVAFLSRTITTTLTITNNHSDDRTLVFDYTLTGGGSVSGIITETSGSYSATLAAGASVTITLTSPSGASTNTLTLSGLQLLSAGNVTSTFLAPENGSYTVDGTSITAETTFEKAASEPYALVATPASGYMFFGWYSEASDSYVSYNATASLKFGSDPQLKPVFIPASTALFGVGAATFYDLTEACNYALTASTKTVVLLNNGTVSGSHTIPAGITLLIPFDAEHTLYRDEPACTSSPLNNVAWVQPTAYRTLTLAADADITVNGSISISAKHAASQGGKPYCGAPTGPVGWVKMVEGSNITLNSGANLYAWGYIQGAGTITAKSGAKVYENFQFTDFRGGSNITAIAGDGLVFPINQYYVQNIEVPTTYEAGAEEYVYTSAYATGMTLGGIVKFIGDGGMFLPEAGASLTKDYIENRDRLQIDVSGNSKLSSMTVNFSIEVNSATYVLPITNNITINLNSGTTTLAQSVALLPGAELNIGKDATLAISKNETAINDYNTYGYHLIAYDRDEWFYGFDLETGETVTGVQYAFGSSTGLRALPFAPGRTYTRTAVKDLNDAVIDVNGTIIADGYLYTTLGGAAIKSSGKTGTIVMNSGSGLDMFTFQANGGTSLGIMMNSAALMNGDGSYLNTITFDQDFNVEESAAAGTTYNYCATHDCWYTGECEACAAVPDFVEITWVVNGENSTGEVAYNTVPTYPGSTPTKASDANGHYTFAGWATSENGAVLETLPAATENATYYAVFTSAAHNDDKIEGGKHYCSVCGYLIASCSDTTPEDHNCDVGGEKLTEHKYTSVVTAPTCTEQGYTTHTCSICDDSYVDTYVGATGHSDSDDKDHNCDVCGATNIEGHTAGAAVQENVVGATCEAKGSYDSVVYCTECGAEISRENKATDALGHDWSDATYTWSADGKTCTAERVCARDASHKETATATVTSEVTKPATCTEKGETTYTATFDEVWAEPQTKTVADIAAKGHVDADKDHNCDHNCGENMGTHADADKDHDCDYGCSDTIGTHSDTEGDGDHVCDYGCGETLTSCEATGVERENYVAPTCTEEGSYDSVTYCGECGKENSRTHKTVPATGHKWGETTYVWSGSSAFPDSLRYCTATRVCETDAAHVESEKVEVTYETTVTPTCTTEGELKYIADFTADWAEDQYKFGVIPTIIHDTEYTYTDNGDGTHNVNYTCHEGVKEANVSHTYVDGVCVCGAVQKFSVTYYFNGGVLVLNEDTKNFLIEQGYTVTDEYITLPPMNYDSNLTIGLGMLTREGYTLTSFVDKSGKTYDLNVTIKVTEDLELTAQWTVNTYTISWDTDGDGNVDVTTTVEYGTVPTAPEASKAADDTFTYTFKGWDKEVVAVTKNTTYTATFAKTGWDGKTYLIEDVIQKTGWTEIDDAWYYLNTETGIRAEGVARVPYPTMTIEGITYGPDQETIEYCAGKGVEFIDEETGLFLFGEDGKFRYTESGIGTYLDATRYAVNGMLPWHPGLVEKDGSYYYFIGDEAVGGNIAATGDVYVGRNTTELDVTISGVYTFDKDGKLCEYDGITEVNGIRRYYENYQLMLGKGLIKVGEDYYYVKSDGSLVVGTKYWVAKTNGYNVAVGEYEFDEDGKLINPVDPEKNGIYEEDGGLFYYENGKRTYKGLIEIDGDYYYVRSNGQLATGRYWITTTNDLMPQGFYNFAEDGKLIGQRNGIVDVDGTLYYFVDDVIQYNAGLLQLEDGSYIYVRSNGVVATGKYWITNNNDLLPQGFYNFGTDGKMIME